MGWKSNEVWRLCPLAGGPGKKSPRKRTSINCTTMYFERKQKNTLAT